MKLSTVLAASVFAISGMLAANQASAQAFLGASIGQGKVDDAITTDLITSGTIDGKGTAWKIFGGYMFDRHFGFESAYVSLDDVSYSGDFFGSAVTGGKVEVSGFNIAFLASYPVSAQFSVFGKLGLFFWDTQASDFTVGLGAFTTRNDGADVSFGLGAGYQFTPNLGVRAEWERFRVELLGTADADLLSIGVVYRFF